MDELKFRNELRGPILGLEFYNFNSPVLLEKIKSVISVHASQERIEQVLRLLKSAQKRDGFAELKEGLLVNHKRIIWTHNDFLVTDVGISGLEHKKTVEIKDMEKEIMSKSATILQCDSKNVVEHCEEIIKRYNLFGFVTDQVGDIVISLENFEYCNISFRDYPALKSLARKSYEKGSKLKVIIDEKTPSGKEFLRHLQTYKIDPKLFQIESAEGEYNGVRKYSKKIKEPHIMVSVRAPDIKTILNENHMEFDRIPHGDVVFLDKRYSKKSLLDPYLVSIKEQKCQFNRVTPKSLYDILSSMSNQKEG